MIARLSTVSRASLFTRLDFRPKMLWVGVVTLLVFLWESPVASAALLLLVLGASGWAGVKASYLRLIITIMAPFYALVLLTHGFWNVEQVKLLSGHATLTPLFTFPSRLWLVGGARFSAEGALYGCSVIWKTLALVLVVPLAIFTTDVDRMIVGMVRARIPYRMTFVFSATLRFFPVLFEDLETIIEAQRLRGLALERMGPVRRVRVYARVAVPLILGAMVKAQQLEVVLQSKAFTGSPDRTYLHESVLRRDDWIALLAGIAALAGLVFLYVAYGVGKFAWLLPA